MRIIPVVDLKNGQVVHAIRGDRLNYQPVQSTICSTSNPADVIAALLDASQAKTVYIADLDAINNPDIQSGNNFQIIEQLCSQYHDITFWIDAGFNSLDQIRHWHQIHNFRPVIGTESHKDIDSLLGILKPDYILSLDFKDNVLCGPDKILNQSENWPDDVIIMSLNTVGSQQGPDLNLINQIKLSGPRRHLYAAGGIRNQSDIMRLEQIGVQGALIATAFHAGLLSFK